MSCVGDGWKTTTTQCRSEAQVQADRALLGIWKAGSLYEPMNQSVFWDTHCTGLDRLTFSW